MHEGLKTRLERLCGAVDEVLAGQGVTTRVVGGYYAGDGVLLSLDDPIFLQTAVVRRLQNVLEAREVVATVGVVLVNGWRQRPSPQGAPLPPAPAQVETMDLLELMAIHRAEQDRPLLPAPAAAQQRADAEDDQKQRPDQPPGDVEKEGGGDQRQDQAAV